MRLYLAMLLLGGCGFELSSASDVAVDASDAPLIDAPVTEIDAAIDAPPPPLDIAHLATIDEQDLNSATDYTLTGVVTINTTTGTITPAIPTGVVVRNVGQENGGLALMVIQARRIDVQGGATVQVTGTRGVVFVAKEDIVVSGILDASAERTSPGPGGYPPSNGPGAGGDAAGTSGDETGAAGASYGTRGGSGGTCNQIPMTGPASAAIYGSLMLTSLEGGSGGGNGLASSAPGPCGLGGGGGGAIQLSAPLISITGRVSANGGGGDGGRRCNTTGTSDASSGSGGGTGGAIYIQAQALSGTGWLVANGGGGGGGGCVQCTQQSGGPGDDGHDDATPAVGGTSPLTPPALGGTGATAVQGMTGGTGGNAGGGGGGAGRIFLAVPSAAAISVSASPPAQR